MTLFLGSGGKANTLYGDGKLIADQAAEDKPDGLVYEGSLVHPPRPALWG